MSENQNPEQDPFQITGEFDAEFDSTDLLEQAHEDSFHAEQGKEAMKIIAHGSRENGDPGIMSGVYLVFQPVALGDEQDRFSEGDMVVGGVAAQIEPTRMVEEGYIKDFFRQAVNFGHGIKTGAVTTVFVVPEQVGAHFLDFENGYAETTLGMVAYGANEAGIVQGSMDIVVVNASAEGSRDNAKVLYKRMTGESGEFCDGCGHDHGIGQMRVIEIENN